MRGEKRKSVLAIAIGALVLAVFQKAAEAHPDIEIQIARISADLKGNPDSWQLYLLRAELYRSHQEWTNAAADYERCLKLNQHTFRVYLGRGQMLHEMGRLNDAVDELSHYIDLIPDDAAGYSARGQVLSHLGRNKEAASDFDRAIALNPSSGLADYLQRAKVLAACGTNRLQEAIRGLDAAPAQFRQSVLIHDLAVELEMKAGHVDAALKRLDKHFGHLPRKEWWQARRGELLEKAGRNAAALEAYTATLNHIAALPDHLRKTRAVADLEVKTQKAIIRLEHQTKQVGITN